MMYFRVLLVRKTTLSVWLPVLHAVRRKQAAAKMTTNLYSQNTSMLQQHAHCPWTTTNIKLIIFVAYGACWACLRCHNPLNSDKDYETFNVCTDVNACDCSRGCTDTNKRVDTKSCCWEKNPLACRTRESSLCQQCASLTLYQLSYIPTHLKKDNFLCTTVT